MNLAKKKGKRSNLNEILKSMLNSDRRDLEFSKEIVDKIVSSMKTMNDTDNKIISLIERIFKTLDAIIFSISFIFGILVWSIFSDSLIKFFPSSWSNLSEEWKIAIFVLFGGIPAAIFSGIILKLINIYWLDNLKVKTQETKD